MFLSNIDDEISLKIIDLSDAESLFELIDSSREHLKEWLPWLDYNTEVADSKTFIQTSLKGFIEQQNLDTIILYKSQMVGIAGFNSINWSNKTANIGYWLADGYQGKGIMTKVSRGLVDYAFDYLNLNKVEIRVASANHKSRKIPERLGFTKEGCLREAEWLYDHFVDHIVYGMLAEEWAKLN